MPVHRPTSIINWTWFANFDVKLKVAKYLFFIFRTFQTDTLKTVDSRTDGGDDTKDDDVDDDADDKESLTEASQENNYFDQSEEVAKHSKNQKDFKKPRTSGQQQSSQHTSVQQHLYASSEREEEEGEMILTCKVVRKNKK